MRQLKSSAQDGHDAMLEIELIFHKHGELTRMRSAWLNDIKTFPGAYA